MLGGYRRDLLLASVLALATTQQVFGENDPIPKPSCDDSKTVTIRYSSTSERLYLEAGPDGERGGCVTLTEIFDERGGKAPLYAVDPSSGNRSVTATGTWLLTESLYVEDGITLNVSRALTTAAAVEVQPLSPLGYRPRYLSSMSFVPSCCPDLYATCSWFLTDV